MNPTQRSAGDKKKNGLGLLRIRFVRCLWQGAIQLEPVRKIGGQKGTDLLSEEQTVASTVLIVLVLSKN